MADSPPQENSTTADDLLSLQILQQGLRYIQDSQANKQRDFLVFQTAMLTGEPVLLEMPDPEEKTTETITVETNGSASAKAGAAP